MTRVFRLITVSLLLGTTMTMTTRAADDATFIPLPSGALAADVATGGAVVSGGLRSGGAFYWMPTTGVVYTGGAAAGGLSRDGRTIAGLAFDAQGHTQAGI